MKTSITYILFFVFLSIIMTAQDAFRTDTIVYVTPEEEAFMIDKDTKGLLKFNPLVFSLPGINESIQFDLGYEFKVGKYFSIFPRIHVDYLESTNKVNRLGGNLESRFYYGQKERFKNGSYVNNLSGKFIGGFYERTTSINDQFQIGYDTEYMGVKWGIQNRFLNYGYIDRHISLGYSRWNFDEGVTLLNSFGNNQITLNSGIEFAFGLGNNYKLTDDAKCPIFKCNEDRSAAWKINQRRVWAIYYVWSNEGDYQSRMGITLNPNLIYESKIGPSSFTINHDFDMKLNFSSYDVLDKKNSFNLSNISVAFRSGIRNYFLQKHQISRGTNGNNLSGFYGFLRGELRANTIYQLSRTNPELFERVWDNSLDVQLGIGYQKEVLNNLFIDIDLGLSKSVYDSIDLFDSSLDVVSDIKVGVMMDHLLQKQVSRILNLY